jgi:hypothetical protein
MLLVGAETCTVLENADQYIQHRGYIEGVNPVTYGKAVRAIFGHQKSPIHMRTGLKPFRETLRASSTTITIVFLFN